MKITIFGNGAIGKTLRAIEDFGTEILSVDVNAGSKPDMVGDINDESLRRKVLSKGDLLIDLTANNDAVPVSEWCSDRGIAYLNSDMSSPTMFTDVEVRFDEIRGIFKRRNKKRGSTVFYCQGMNPGMVSHYFAELIRTYGIAANDIEEVHISEIDTQISDRMPEKNTLISTWCVSGSFTDALDESSLHKKDYWASRLGEIRARARDNHYWTRNPWDGRFNTYLSGNHEEIYEIGKKYDIPTCFSYKPPVQFNEASKHMEREDLFVPHVMSEDTICGQNTVGIYLRNKAGKEYWCGSRLDISSARKLIRNKVEDLVLNATTVLTASGVYAGARYIMERSEEGWIMPLEADSAGIVSHARKFLGEFFIGELKQ